MRLGRGWGDDSVWPERMHIVIMKRLTVNVEKTGTGYSAYAEKYPVYTTGTDVKELERNIKQAFEFYFEESSKKTTITRKNLSLRF